MPAKRFGVAIPERVIDQREPVADERQPLAGAEHIHRPGTHSLGWTFAVCDPVRFGEPEREPRFVPVRER